MDDGRSGRTPATRGASLDARTTTGRSWPANRRPRSTAHRSTSRPSASRTDQGRAWGADVAWTSITSPFPPDRRNVGLSHPVRPYGHEVLEEQKPAKDCSGGSARRTSSPNGSNDGGLSPDPRILGANPLWGRLDDAMKLYRTAAQASDHRGEGAARRQRRARCTPSTSSPTCRQGRAGPGSADAAKWAAAELQKIYG